MDQRGSPRRLATCRISAGGQPLLQLEPLTEDVIRFEADLVGNVVCDPIFRS